VHYSDDPNQTFPLIVFIHGWGSARFIDAYTEQVPLSNLATVNLSGLINGSYGTWDTTRPFIVLSPQKCVDPLTYVVTAERMKLFIDYAVRTYKVDPTRIYLGGHSQGSGDTWDYVTNYPQQLAAIFPISGGYGTSVGCVLKDTPAWAFAGQNDTAVASDQVATVGSINACNPVERAKVTIIPGAGHDDAETDVLTLSALGQGLPQYDLYDQSIYDWLLDHTRASAASNAVSGHAGGRAGANKAPADGVAFQVTPEEIAAGERATIRWSFAGARSCAASGDWLGPRAADGAEASAPSIPGLYHYVLTCSGSRGTAARTVELTVEAAGTVRVARVVLDAYAGRYRLAASEAVLRMLGREIVVTREGGHLLAEARGLRAALNARSETAFQAKGPDVALTFLGNGNPRCPKIAVDIPGLQAFEATRIE
jgi:predicted esterase